jgi:DNA-binding transcriptional LysR family regulator
MQLKLFLDLSTMKNFTKVSERNYLTQPAVSKQIQRLEEELGARLFERTKRKVILTEEGHLLVAYATDMLRKFDEIKSLFLERKGKVVGRLKIATTVSIGLYILPTYLKLFIKQFPHVDLHVEYQLPERIYDLLLSGESDLGIMAYPEKRNDIITIPFMDDEIVIICPPHHPWAHKKRVRLHQIKNHELIALDENTPTGKAIRQRLNELGIPVRLKMEYDNIEVIKKTVEMGLGISLVPRQSVVQEAKNHTLVSIRVSDMHFERPLTIVYWKGKLLSKTMQAFIDILTPGAEGRGPRAEGRAATG